MSGSDSDRESDESDDVGSLPAAKIQPAAGRRGPRASVSAEVFGKWNQKKEFVAPKHEKAPTVRQALQKRLEQAFMFSSLNPQELQIVLDAMQGVKKSPGEKVIVEGEEGDCLYVVESGVLTCTKIFVRLNMIPLIITHTI